MHGIIQILKVETFIDIYGMPPSFTPPKNLLNLTDPPRDIPKGCSGAGQTILDEKTDAALCPCPF